MPIAPVFLGSVEWRFSAHGSLYGVVSPGVV
jgi:hypothetical protein